jgi:hypothetical protein
MVSRPPSVWIAAIAISLLTIAARPCPILGQQAATYSGRYHAQRDGFVVTTFGARCDGVADDSRAFQAALDAAGVRCQRHGAYIVAGFATVIVPDGARCRINSALTDSKSDCVGIASDAGATLDFSGLVGGGTALTLSISPMVPIQVISRGLRTLR